MFPNVIILDDLIPPQMNFKWKSNILVKNWILTGNIKLSSSPHPTQSMTFCLMWFNFLLLKIEILSKFQLRSLFSLSVATDFQSVFTIYIPINIISACDLHLHTFSPHLYLREKQQIARLISETRSRKQAAVKAGEGSWLLWRLPQDCLNLNLPLILLISS